MTNERVFLRILNSFLHPEEKLHGTRRLEAEDWEEILNMAASHAVLPIVYDAARKKTSFQKLPQELRMGCKVQVQRRVITQMQTTALFLDLYKRITNLGVTPLVMKGVVCRNMYTQPDYRVSGDEDMLVEVEQFPKLDQILLQCGFQREQVDDYKKEHEITYFHPGNAMHLEVHLSLFPEESGSYGRLNQEFPNVFERQIVENIQGVEVHTLDVTQHMLYLLCHGLKHFLHCGFGIRQLCDMILFAETYGDKIDWVEVKQRTRRQNMYIFWMNLFDIGEKYLGFLWAKAGLVKPEKDILNSEEMLADILDSGVFGHSSADRTHSANITLQAASGETQKKSGIVASLFPSVDYMSRNYTYVEKNKWLLLVAWGQRMLEYRKKMSGQSMTKPIETGKQRVKLLEKYGIIEEK